MVIWSCKPKIIVLFPKKQNDPPWFALLRGVVGSVNTNIYSLSNFVKGVSYKNNNIIQ